MHTSYKLNVIDLSNFETLMLNAEKGEKIWNTALAISYFNVTDVLVFATRRRRLVQLQAQRTHYNSPQFH